MNKQVVIIFKVTSILVIFLFCLSSIVHAYDDRIEQLIHELEHKDQEVRLAAGQALVEIGKPAVKPLIEVMKDDDQSWWIRLKATAILGEIKDGRAVEPLIAALKYKQGMVREAAAQALGKIGDSKAIEPLATALKDKHEYNEVRRASAEALGKIGDAGAVEPLIDALGDDVSWIREEAAYALSKITGKDFGEGQKSVGSNLYN